MPDPFDPYHRWLGIPPEDQPPHHYRLLGIAPFEDQPEVIEHAADRQMAHLRTFQVGPHAALSQRLLNEVAAAKLCLLRAEKKAAYDDFLRDRLAGAGRARSVSAEAVTPPPFPVAPPDEESPVVELEASGHEPGEKPSESSPAVAAVRRRRWLTAGAGILALGLVVGIVVLASVLTSPSSLPDTEIAAGTSPTAEPPEDPRQDATVALDKSSQPASPPGPPNDDVTDDETAFWESLAAAEAQGEEAVAAASPKAQESGMAAPGPPSAAAKAPPKAPPPNETAAAKAAPPEPSPPAVRPKPPVVEPPPKKPQRKPEPFRTVAQVDPVLAEAWALIRRGEHAKGRETLVQASKINRDDLRVAFSLGLVDALLTLDWSAAEKEFLQCVQEHPKHVASLNNLALVRLRLGRETNAVRHWQTALGEGPPPAEIVQNLGRVRYLLQKGRLSFKLVTQKAIDNLYADALAASNARFYEDLGFQYIGLYGGGDPDFGWSESHDYEDRWCVVCNARGKMKCPEHDCAHGQVTRMSSKVIGFNPLTKAPIYQSGPVRVPCTTCRGSGSIPCVYCREGKDKQLP